jgi:hypothetical protein
MHKHPEVCGEAVPVSPPFAALLLLSRPLHSWKMSLRLPARLQYIIVDGRSLVRWISGYGI